MKFGDLKVLLSRAMEKARAEAAKNNKSTVKFVVIAYKRVLQILAANYTDRETVTETRISELPLTSHMKKKLLVLSKKPIPKSTQDKKLKKIEKLQLELSNLYGIGNKKIKDLLSAGLSDISQLKQKKYFNMLNTDTQIMLMHNPLRKVPHEDIKKIEPILTSFPHAYAQIVGSFRRKMPYSKDIDILLKSADPAMLDRYIEHLQQRFRGNVYLYAQGNDRVSLVIRPNDIDSKYKIDIFRADPDMYYSQLLYSTGPKDFNIKMRSKAKKLGYLLNQNGIFKKVGSGWQKINKPEDTEEVLSKYLDMDYLPPEKRI